MAVARLGLLGGAFDPPHLGHVALARAALEQLGVERLLVLVVADPGHKQAVAPAADRVELARLAFEDLPGVEVELDPHPRTVDSLLERKPPDAVFVLGADEFVDLPRWKDPERVLGLVRVAVAMRPGVPDDRVREAHARLPSPDRISYFHLQPVPVSSSLVRGRAARGESLAGLVPPKVAEAIRRLGLYRGAEYTAARGRKAQTD